MFVEFANEVFVVPSDGPASHDSRREERSGTEKAASWVGGS